jgi:hypothetical protein
MLSALCGTDLAHRSTRYVRDDLLPQLAAYLITPLLAFPLVSFKHFTRHPRRRFVLTVQSTKPIISFNHNKVESIFEQKRKAPMPNITLNVDDEIIKKVRKIAVDKNTTLTAMVRDFLTSMANRDEYEKREAVRGLGRTFERLSRDMGSRKWTREDLHAR